MSDGRVLLDVAGGIARIVFDRPGARNAMTDAMYAQLAAALERIEAMDDVHAVVLRGAGGRAFVAGTDIAGFTRFRSAEEGLRYERTLEAHIARLEALPVPTVAVIDGAAAGAGLVLAAVCDLRVCTPDARFGMPIARTVGNALSLPNIARLVAHLGPGRVKAMLFTAEPMTAGEAHGAGFVTEIVEAAALETRVESLCATLAAHAPLTLRATKEAVRRVTAAAGNGDDLLRTVYGSTDFREGVAAFLAKRPPGWQGR